MKPHALQQFPEYIVHIVPSFRPAYESEIIDANGKFIKKIFFQYCPQCDATHSIQINLPIVDKSDSPFIREAKRRAYFQTRQYYREVIYEGDVWLSVNNIDFIIELNLN